MTETTAPFTIADAHDFLRALCRTADFEITEDERALLRRFSVVSTWALEHLIAAEAHAAVWHEHVAAGTEHTAAAREALTAGNRACEEYERVTVLDLSRPIPGIDDVDLATLTTTEPSVDDVDQDLDDAPAS